MRAENATAAPSLFFSFLFFFFFFFFFCRRKTGASGHIGCYPMLFFPKFDERDCLSFSFSSPPMPAGACATCGFCLLPPLFPQASTPCTNSKLALITLFSPGSTPDEKGNPQRPICTGREPGVPCLVLMSRHVERLQEEEPQFRAICPPFFPLLSPKSLS